MPSGFQAFGNAEGFVGSVRLNPFPPIANLKLRLESDLGITESGGLISSWLDQTGSVAAFTASTTARPTHVANQIGSVPAVRFNGSTNVMTTVDLLSVVLGAGTPAAYKVVAVMKNNSAVAHAATSYSNPGVFTDNASYFAGMAADSTRIDTGLFGSGDHLVSIVQATGSLIYVEATLTAAASGTLSLQIGTGGSPTSSTGVGTVGQSGGGMQLGASYNNAVFWAGDLFALYAGTSMTAPEVAALQTYINIKYGPGL